MTKVTSFLTLATLLSASPIVMEAAESPDVRGRFIRIEAPASSRMALHEIEAWSGKANIALKDQSLKLTGTIRDAKDGNLGEVARSLVDGVVDFASRGMELRTAAGVNPWVEVDLGGEHSIERIVVSQIREPLYDDRAIRLVTVLDARRRVVWASCYDIRVAPYGDGVADFSLKPMRGSLIGRVVPERAGQWAALGDVLEAVSVAPPDAAERAERFARRSSPSAIEQLARDFFARVDLTRPELTAIKAKFERREFAAALDAWRDHFLAKLQRVAFRHEGKSAQTPYDAAAEDLLSGVAVVFARYDVAAQKFTPGTIDWAAVPQGDQAGADLARTNAKAGRLQKPLLAAYREEGRVEFLKQWAAITDDWGMNIVRDLARAELDLRSYFVKNEIQEFNHLVDEIAQTVQRRPDFARQVSGATFARLLIPVLEEYLPAYWWVCRRASFNHTYNALNAATITSRILDDFHAGQRLDNENRQHWHRVWTSNMTRDGSMNEISDEGHLFMQWRMAAYVDQMKRMPPPWMSPDFFSEFETGWRQTAVYPLRHLTPDGYGQRLGDRDYDYFKKVWWLTDPNVGFGELASNSALDFTDIVREPEFASIMQSAFGAGRDRATLSKPRQEAWDRVTGFYGLQWEPPTTISDWMPYAGLHYLRRSWEPDATYVHMLSQPKGHPSTNCSAWNTEFHYFDFGQPLLACSPVWIDGNPPFNEAGTLTYKPGSKTETLATASERPISARWHTSALLDYAESFYEGTYQEHRAEFGEDLQPGQPVLGENPVKNARADRRVILFRPARLLIVTDAVRAPRSASPRRYDVRQRFATPDKTGKDPAPAGRFQGDASNLTLINDNAPGVTVRRFTTATLSWDKRNTPDSWERPNELGGPGGAAMMNHSGVLENRGGILRAETRGNLLMSALIEPHRHTGETVIKTATDLSTGAITGFEATLEDGSRVTWLATGGEARLLKAGPLEVRAEALLLYQSPSASSDRTPEMRGIVLGCARLEHEGEKVALPGADFEFAVPSSPERGARAGGWTFASIHRPIEPVTFSPQEPVFTDTVKVSLSSATPGMEIRYTLDGREPDLTSPLYKGALVIDKDAYIRARAFRPGLKATPFAAAGTDATVVSDARYHRRSLKPAQAPTEKLVRGLRWELVEDSWRALFSHLNLPEVMPAVVAGHTRHLLDVSMRRGDGPFGVRYDGYIDVPADGVWTFHPPEEYMGASCEPGYDLRVWIDGEEWDLGQRFHGRGLWSVPLAKGLHRFQVSFADARHRDRTVHDSGLWGGYPRPWVVWKGKAPVIEISGPGFDKQPVRAQWLRRPH